MDASQTTMIQAPGLGRKIGLAWAALAWEGLWPRMVPLVAFVALFIAAAHLDFFAGTPVVDRALLRILVVDNLPVLLPDEISLRGAKGGGGCIHLAEDFLQVGIVLCQGAAADKT